MRRGGEGEIGGDRKSAGERRGTDLGWQNPKAHTTLSSQLTRVFPWFLEPRSAILVLVLVLVSTVRVLVLVLALALVLVLVLVVVVVVVSSSSSSN